MTVQTMPRRTWLIQRLQKPAGSGPLGQFTEAFAFGGGLRNGGLSPDAMAMLRPIMSFDYMGAAEFEWGEVPKALQGIAKRARHLAAFSIEIDLSTVPVGWRAPKGTPQATGTTPIFVLCAKEHREAVSALIREFAAGQERLKERTCLTGTLRPVEDWDARTVGWLELDNGFFFFTDQTMWAQVCDLFGVKR